MRSARGFSFLAKQKLQNKGNKTSRRLASHSARSAHLAHSAPAKKLGFSGKVLLALVACVFIALFFAAALSLFDDTVKTGLCLLDLFLAGVAFHKLTGVESYYGLLLLKSKAGFALMKSIARRFETQCVWLADWGLAIGFGLPYAWFCRRKQKRSVKSFAWQAVAAAAFSVVIFSSQAGAAGSGLLLFAVTLASGLFGFAFYFLAEHAWKILTVAQTPPGVIPVVPGVTIPIEAIVAVAIIMVVHEVAHGVMFEIARLRLKSSGVLLFGWMPIGAFVEPDEDAFKSLRLREKRRALVAGSTSNALFFLVFLALWLTASFASQSLIAGVAVSDSRYPQLLPDGATIAFVNGVAVRSSSDVNSVFISSAAACASCAGESIELRTKSGERVFVPPTALAVKEVKAGAPAQGVLNVGEVIYSIDGATVSSISELKAALSSRKPGELITLETSAGGKKLVLGSSDASASSNAGSGVGVIGAVFSQERAFAARNVPAPGAEFVFALASLLVVILYWTFVLNLILAAINLLPVFITDGQRIFYEEFCAVLGKKKGALASIAVGVITLALFVVNALPWLWFS